MHFLDFFLLWVLPSIKFECLKRHLLKIIQQKINSNNTDKFSRLQAIEMKDDMYFFEKDANIRGNGSTGATGAWHPPKDNLSSESPNFFKT